MTTIILEELELAANACGYEVESFAYANTLWVFIPEAKKNRDGDVRISRWSPLNSAEDREQLAMAISARVDFGNGTMDAAHTTRIHRFISNDPQSYGEALIQAAAELQRSKRT